MHCTGLPNEPRMFATYFGGLVAEDEAGHWLLWIPVESLQGCSGFSYKAVAFELANIVEPLVTKSEFSGDSCEIRV